ncbi:hypothetical protein F4781DRAFT_440655 [Annulohypoxylon bovei var. microspora]|nr:hypothetical protein F4781DRAFT_440655 [Annulohypoxylon bovei var. microspora]
MSTTGEILTGATVEGIVKLPDPHHPLAHHTVKNDQTYFFMLPLEVRLMIYEYVVAVGKPIQPRQIIKGSNKFTWGKASHSHGYDDLDVYPHQGNLESSEPVPLEIITLARVSRRIYHDLEGRPVFYRINSFQFEQVEDLHIFLSAITPKRRAMIRYIALNSYLDNRTYMPRWPRTVQAGDYISRTTNYDSNCCLLPLLSQCKGLKELSGLKLCMLLDSNQLKAISSVPLDAPSVLNLPFVQIKTRLTGAGYFTLGDSHHIPISILKKMWSKDLDDDSLFLPEHIELIHWTQKLNSSMVKRRRPEDGNMRPQWFVDLGSEARVKQAIDIAKINFPGEIRIDQDRFKSVVGPVSSRTRRKNWTVDPELGIFRYQTPKYGAEGAFVAWNYDVTGLRWNDELELECLLTYLRPDRDPATSWESADKVVLTHKGEKSAYYFYTCRLREARSNMSGKPRKVLLELLQTVPSPHDVIKFVGGIKNFLPQTSDGTFKSKGDKGEQADEKKHKQGWQQLSKDWTFTIAKLEKEVAVEASEAEKAATREESSES